MPGSLSMRPENSRYQHESRAAFGAELQLPEPFDFALATSDLA
jgi:hypothetical protein